jgi:hypothetical protein
MPRHHHRLIVALTTTTIAATLLLSACAQKAPPTPTKAKPATVEKIAGSNLSRVVLTEEAARRIDLRTEQIGDLHQGAVQRLVMPYAAIIYDKAGDTWAYTAAAEPNTFVRQSVSVDSIDGKLAYLTNGPAPGTNVVTVGVAELYGAEFGIGK